MYHVLQQSTCRHGKRRRVAKRTLNALGWGSGLCGIVNGPDQLRELKSGLQFADSFEQIKHAEKKRKLAIADSNRQKKEKKEKDRAEKIAKARAKNKEVYNSAMKKLKLAPDEEIRQDHLIKLTGPQLKVICLVITVYTGVFQHHHFCIWNLCLINVFPLGCGICPMRWFTS